MWIYRKSCLQEASKSPVEIFKRIANQEFIRIHGPEHHILDGAALLTAYYNGGVPSQMLMIDVPEAEYIVFEHGPFDFEKENCSVEAKIEEAMRTFDYSFLCAVA